MIAPDVSILTGKSYEPILYFAFNGMQPLQERI